MANLPTITKSPVGVVQTRNRHPRPPYDPDFQASADEEGPRQPHTLESIRLVRRRFSDEAQLELRNDASIMTWEIDIDRVLDPRKYDAQDEAVDQQTVRLVVVEPREVNHTEPSPCFLFLHGGVLCAATAYVGLHNASVWARQYNAVTVSVEYGLAPEAKGEEPAKDCYAALLWIQAAAERGWDWMRSLLLAQRAARAGEGVSVSEPGTELTLPRTRIDPRRVLMYGASAGGNLAAATAILARDREGPGRQMLCGLFLEAPMLCHKANTISSEQYAHSKYEFDTEASRYGWACHLDGQAPKEGNTSDTRRVGLDITQIESPGLATHLGDLPPMFLDCGSAEPFRDEIVQFAARSWACGGDTELHVWPGVPHGYAAKDPHATVSRQSLRTREDWIQRVITRGAPCKIDSV
jgi:acetyl esterase/lipase